MRERIVQLRLLSSKMEDRVIEGGVGVLCQASS